MNIIQSISRLFCKHQAEIDFLNRKVADLQKLIPIEVPVPEIELLSILGSGVKLDIQPLNLKMMYPALIDSKYYYSKAEDWAKVFGYIYFEFDMPKYLSDTFDCDDFAVLLKGLVASFFGLNYFGVVFGKTPTGYHSYNIFRTEGGLLQLEPQTGDMGELGEHGYQAEYILL